MGNKHLWRTHHCVPGGRLSTCALPLHLSSSVRQVENMYTHVYIHIHIYICMYVILSRINEALGEQVMSPSSAQGSRRKPSCGLHVVPPHVLHRSTSNPHMVGGTSTGGHGSIWNGRCWRSVRKNGDFMLHSFFWPGHRHTHTRTHTHKTDMHFHLMRQALVKGLNWIKSLSLAS